jgi:hypothetical protein
VAQPLAFPEERYLRRFKTIISLREKMWHKVYVRKNSFEAGNSLEHDIKLRRERRRHTLLSGHILNTRGCESVESILCILQETEAL